MDWAGLSLGDYKYPAWAEAVGWGLCLASVLCVPGYAIYRIFSEGSSRPISEVKESINSFSKYRGSFRRASVLFLKCRMTASQWQCYGNV